MSKAIVTAAPPPDVFSWQVMVTWFRSNARIQPRIVALTSVYQFNPLVEHFIAWYSRPELDVDKIILCVTQKTREPVEAVKNDRCLLHLVPEITDDPKVDDATNLFKDRGEADAWQKLGFTAEDYKLTLDLDEFQTYPWSLREIVEEMTQRKEWALAGILVDRFAADYSTPAVRPMREMPLEKQFPIARQWPVRDWPELLDQKTPWGACMTKVVICRGPVTLVPGRHRALNAVIARHAQFGFCVTDLKVHHYRWTQGVTQLLQRRTADLRWDERYRNECVGALAWLSERQKSHAQMSASSLQTIAQPK